MTNILGYGELMLRHTPSNSFIKTNKSKEFKTNFGGSESNSLCFLASKGHNCTFLSAFPKNDLGLKSIKFLENHNVKPKVIFDDNRLGLYYTIPGKKNKLSKIVYDRENSSFSKYRLSQDFINKIFEDISYLIISGISPALSKICYENIMKMVEVCKNNDIKIIYDINYRANLWSLEDCKKFNLKMLKHVDFLFSNVRTLSKVFDHLFKVKNDEFFFQTKDAINFIRQKFKIPNIGMTVRVNDMLGGVLFKDESIYLSEIYKVNQIDRVGAGDVFLAANMNCFFNNYDAQNTISYATSAFALSHTKFGDVNILNDDEIEDFKINSIKNVNR